MDGIDMIPDLHCPYNEQGTVDRYNVYHASMLIRHGKDGKYYLYDVLDIKKETSNPF